MTSSTARRVPFTTGFPTSTFGSMLMCSCHVIKHQDTTRTRLSRGADHVPLPGRWVLLHVGKTHVLVSCFTIRRRQAKRRKRPRACAKHIACRRSAKKYRFSSSACFRSKRQLVAPV